MRFDGDSDGNAERMRSRLEERRVLRCGGGGIVVEDAEVEEEEAAAAAAEGDPVDTTKAAALGERVCEARGMARRGI